MPLSQYQGDLLLDVFEACRNVRDLYDRKEQAQIDGTDEDVQELTRLYDSAVEYAADRYGEGAMYLPEALLDNVANDMLPEHLMVGAVDKPGQPETIESD